MDMKQEPKTWKPQTRIRELRLALGLTGVELARRVGIRPQRLAEYESGAPGMYRVPRRERLGRLAAVLGVKPEEIFTGRLRQPNGMS